MPEAYYLFDTVALSNFALSETLDLLDARYGRDLLITGEVQDEIADGVVAGYANLQTIQEYVEGGKFGQVVLTMEERHTFRQVLRQLDPGEASCVAAASTRNAVVVTDDRAARACCGERNIPVTGTIGILKAGCLEGVLCADRADEILSQMEEKGFYSPVKRISDIL